MLLGLRDIYITAAPGGSGLCTSRLTSALSSSSSEARNSRRSSCALDNDPSSPQVSLSPNTATKLAGGSSIHPSRTVINTAGAGQVASKLSMWVCNCN